MKAGIIVAMDSELELFRSAGIDNVVKSGIGKVNAAVAATELILSSHPDCIINSGFAGGMAPGLKLGDLVVAERVAYHDVWCGKPNLPGQVEGMPLYYDADSSLLDAARSLGRNLHFGLVASGDQFFISLEEDRRILSVLPDALAADMESAAVAQVCARFGVPFMSIRAISDLHGSVSEQEETYGNFLETAPASLFAAVRELIERI